MTWHLTVVSVVSIWVAVTTVSISTTIPISVWISSITVTSVTSIPIPSIGTSISFWFSFSLSGSLFFGHNIHSRIRHMGSHNLGRSSHLGHTHIHGILGHNLHNHTTHLDQRQLRVRQEQQQIEREKIQQDTSL